MTEANTAGKIPEDPITPNTPEEPPDEPPNLPPVGGGGGNPEPDRPTGTDGR